MNILEIYILDIPYDDIDKSKIRPALIIKLSDKYVYLFKITSKYADKSNRIKSLYYPLKEWKKAGLRMKSYVDIHKQYALDKDVVKHAKLIGKISPLDTIELVRFIKENDKK